MLDFPFVKKKKKKKHASDVRKLQSEVRKRTYTKTQIEVGEGLGIYRTKRSIKYFTLSRSTTTTSGSEIGPQFLDDDPTRHGPVGFYDGL